MIISLRCENFKCFRDTGTLELAPITLLVGENNSGKSSILQSLHLPALTIQSEDPGVCLILLHPDYDYGAFKDIVFQHDEKELITLSYGTMVDIINPEGKLVKIESTLRLTYGYMPIRREIYLNQFVIEGSEGEKLSIFVDKYSGSNKLILRKYEDESVYLSRFIERKGFFFRPNIDPFNFYNRLENKFGEKKAKEIFINMAGFFQFFERLPLSFRKIQLLGPLRVPPHRTYLYSGEIAGRLGPKGEMALPNYAALLKLRRKEDEKKVENIKKALYRLGFIKNINVKKIGTRHYEIWTEHKDSSLEANLADTGFGASQVIPVIVSLYTSPSGSTLLYEQPEIHLHPAGQAELGSVFAQACSQDKRIIIETHSENLILRIQTEVAKGNLKSEAVKIYYIKPRSSGHQVIPIPLDEKGRFKAEWPKGFFEEAYQESLKLSRARRA